MILETRRLVLRDLTIADAAALNDIDRDPRVTRYLPYDPQTPDQSRAYIEADLLKQQEQPRHTFDLVMTLRETGAFIGRCGLCVKRPDHFEAELWYVLHPAHWGRGYAVEAATAMLDFAFGPQGLHRVWADCDPRNTTSCRVAQKLGMTLEGTLRENYRLKGEWCGTAVYALLDREWRPQRTACGIP